MHSSQESSSEPAPPKRARYVVARGGHFFFLLTLMFLVFSALLFVQFLYFQNKIDAERVSAESVHFAASEAKKDFIATYNESIETYNEMVRGYRAIIKITGRSGEQLEELSRNQFEMLDDIEEIRTLYKLQKEGIFENQQEIERLKLMVMLTATPESLKQFEQMIKIENKSKKGKKK